MSILALTSDTLAGTATAGQIEYNGQFYGTDSNAARAQIQRLTLSTAQASTSGTNIDFTSIPAWAKRITVMFSGVSTNGTNIVLLQLGTSSGVVVSGYYSVTGQGTSTTSQTTGIGMTVSTLAADTLYGAATILLQTGFTWVITSATAPRTTNPANTAAGGITLSGTLDRVRVTTVGGTDTFDAGSINILIEG